jgi:putative oxidoreductase
MLSQYQSAFSLAARILLAALFLPAGLSKLFGFTGTVGYIASVGLPLPMVGAVLAVALELLGGLALIAGYQTRWAAMLMALFTVAAGVLFHNFWAAPAEAFQVQQIMFMKNLAIAGGLLALTAFGPGAMSLDAKRGA